MAAQLARLHRCGPKPWGNPSPAAEALRPPPYTGSAHPRAVLDEVVVCDILADLAAGYTPTAIARAYPVLRGNDTRVCQIRSGYIWRHVRREDRQRWVAGLLGTGREPPEPAPETQASPANAR